MAARPDRRSSATPRWVIALGLSALALVIGMAVLHVSGMAPMHHM